MEALLAQSSRGGGGAASLVLFVPLILLFYFMLIRPQRTRMRAQQQLLQTLEVGDEVETVAGMFGTIKRMDEETVWLEVAPGTVLRMNRSAVRRKIVEESETTP